MGIIMRVLKRLFAVAAVIALLLVGVYFIFHIDNVTVEGTEYYSDSEIKNLVFQKKLPGNEVVLWFYEKTVGLGSLPFIETIEVEYHGPRSVTLHVYDKTISGCIKYLGQYVYFENLYIQEYLKAGMDGHTAKPITMELLKEKLAK